MNELNDDLDLKAIEGETRFIVQLINQSPELFSKNPAGIPAIPLEILALARNYASDKDMSKVQAYETFLGDVPDEQWTITPFIGPYGEDVADYIQADNLQGLTPVNVHKGFMAGIQNHLEHVPNLAKIADHYNAGRASVGMNLLGDYLPVENFNEVFVANTERLLDNQYVYLMVRIEEATRPKTALEIELDKIREDFNNPHNDIKIEVGQYEQPEFKKRKRFLAGTSDASKDLVKAKLTESIQKLVDRLSNPELSDSKKWITATIPFDAYNVVTGKPYCAENQALAQMYSEEFGYETGCYISAKQAMERGFSIKGAKTQVFTQRFPIDLNSTEIVNGVKQNKLNADGTPETYRIFTVGYVNMINIDEITWTDKTKPDPKIKMKEAYGLGLEKKPCNQENLEIFNKALAELGYVEIKYGMEGNFFSPSGDFIGLQHENQFRNPLRLAHTMLHELAHATGHKDRQCRQTLYDYHVDPAFRGQEELIANRVAALLIEKYGLHESELKDSYEANNMVYDLGWAKRAYEKDPMSLMDTIGSAEWAFKELSDKIDNKLKQMNVLHLFQKEDVKFEGIEPKVYEGKKQYKSSNKSTNKKQVTV